MCGSCETGGSCEVGSALLGAAEFKMFVYTSYSTSIQGSIIPCDILVARL